jgi:hypothetical protein
LGVATPPFPAWLTLFDRPLNRPLNQPNTALITAHSRLLAACRTLPITQHHAYTPPTPLELFITPLGQFGMPQASSSTRCQLGPSSPGPMPGYRREATACNDIYEQPPRSVDHRASEHEHLQATLPACSAGIKCLQPRTSDRPVRALPQPPTYPRTLEAAAELPGRPAATSPPIRHPAPSTYPPTRRGTGA